MDDSTDGQWTTRVSLAGIDSSNVDDSSADHSGCDPVATISGSASSLGNDWDISATKVGYGGSSLLKLTINETDRIYKSFVRRTLVDPHPVMKELTLSSTVAS
jgi:hypothetical protein